MTLRWSSLLVLLCTACSVGEPLVGEKTFEPGDLHGLCGRPPSCDEPWSPDAPPDHPAEPLHGCMFPRSCSEVGDALGADGCARETVETLPQRANCQELELLADQDVRLEGLQWIDVDLTLRASRAITVTLTGDSLMRVFIQLEGPIALHIEHIDTLDDLRILAAADSGSKPSLSFEAVRGQGVSVGSAEQPFPGSIGMHASMLKDIDLRAQSCNFESAALDKAALRIDSLTFTDVSLSHALLESSTAIVSAFDIQDSVLHFCGDVRLIDGSIVRSELSSCIEQPLRLYASMFFAGVLDGAFELDGSSISGSRVASRDATRILAYNSDFNTAQLCDQLDLLALGVASYARCTNCYDGIADDQPVCELESIKDPLSGNYCLAWQDLEHPPGCGGDLPTRPNRLR